MLHFFPTKISAFVAIAVILCCYGNQMRVYGNCEVGCIHVYEPVCGTDGKTYGNACEMYVQNNCDRTVVKKAYNGVCGRDDKCRIACSHVYKPICGTDGTTYSNACVMYVQNGCDDTVVTKAYDGKCSSIAYKSQDK